MPDDDDFLHEVLSDFPAAERAELEAKIAKADAAPPRKKKPPLRIVGPLTLDSFHAFLPEHRYLYIPTGDLWPATSLNASLRPVEVGFDKDDKPILIKASTWLDQNRHVEQMTWAPGEPQLILDRLVRGGGLEPSPGSKIFNLYRAPPAVIGNPQKAQPWLEHVEHLYPDGWEHIVSWCAHRVQLPQVKINHALVLGGEMGIGKDTLLEPVRRAVGYWNTQTIAPGLLLGRFNGFLKTVILVIAEARDQGDVNRYQLYDHCKAMLAAPPETLTVDEKNRNEYAIVNRLGVVFTTNHKDGLYLPDDDRRHYVDWSPRKKEDFNESYWNEIWRFYEDGGFAHVAAYLSRHSLKSFNPKAPPPHTPAFHDMVDAGRAPEDAELNDLLDELGRPEAVYLLKLQRHATDAIKAWLSDRRNLKTVPHRLRDCGYVKIRNDVAQDGLWRVEGRRQIVYARRDLIIRDQIAAAHRLL